MRIEKKKKKKEEDAESELRNTYSKGEGENDRGSNLCKISFFQTYVKSVYTLIASMQLQATAR